MIACITFLGLFIFFLVYFTYESNVVISKDIYWTVCQTMPKGETRVATNINILFKGKKTKIHI